MCSGEEELLSRDVPRRRYEADQSGGCRGRGGGRFFPRVPHYAGEVPLPGGVFSSVSLSHTFLLAAAY